MAPWLDTAIVSATLLGSGLFLVRLYRKKPAAACSVGCGKCEPPAKTSELVQIGKRKSG